MPFSVLHILLVGEVRYATARVFFSYQEVTCISLSAATLTNLWEKTLSFYFAEMKLIASISGSCQSTGGCSVT
ncbi:hypothetical protein XENOCAPTIV_006602 [Xenoophorus captivus]|uniref:Secreted protein n=1 Tax=Xenoophorus captivus TaxID=1517983 RepID=A0ABV0R7C1_9TELE